jgi:alpha-glucosidase
MFFTKFPHVSNFSFAESYDPVKGVARIGQRAFPVRVRSMAGGIHHVEILGEGLWAEDLRLVTLNAPAPEASKRFRLRGALELHLKGAKGKPLLQSAPGMAFGVMGPAWAMCFVYSKEQRFYGLGEKTFGRLEAGNRKTKFWNTDALSDFHFKQLESSPTDPSYVSVPYLIVRRGMEFAGILVENLCAPFIDTGCDPTFQQDREDLRRIVIGAEDGRPSVWFIEGPTLAELTCKLQKLVGVHPRPPLWALGYHQSRWGYKGEQDLLHLDERMTAHEIPNDGLWIDIDYMRDFRVFTVAEEAFPNGVPATLARLAPGGRRVVPILDPGVKRDAGFECYREGIERGVFCMGPEGKPFVGMVWPGETVFPDFTLPEGREWWAERVRRFFLEHGFGAAWLDMNDPSTGVVDTAAMLWRRGTLPHLAFHNQYALGMQMACHEGFRAAYPERRPFLLSRSGSPGTSRYSAVWTGDNVANRFYLRGSIPATLNLSLSGIPFNGPDVGGFLLDTGEALMIDWVKAGFLFPFFRIHSGMGFRDQEPWSYSPQGLRIIRHYIRLRYKLLPYLYQRFLEHERNGTPILRPVMYHYPGADDLGDQFLVGADILQAPFVDEPRTRSLALPGDRAWFCARTGVWTPAGEHEAQADRGSTPLYFRDGAIVPCAPGEPKDNRRDLRRVEFHLFLSEGTASEGNYLADDGETLAYQCGEVSEIGVRARLEDGNLGIRWEQTGMRYGPIEPTFVLYGPVTSAMVNGKAAKLRPARVRWSGVPMRALRV